MATTNPELTGDYENMNQVDGEQFIDEEDGELAHKTHKTSHVSPKGEIMEFKYLFPAEEAKFRAYAQKNDPPSMEDWYIYHPVCREEWVLRGISPEGEGEDKSYYHAHDPSIAPVLGPNTEQTKTE